MALRNSAGVSVTSTKGKLEVLKRYYQQLGTVVLIQLLMIVGRRKCVNFPTVCVENVLDREIDLEEIALCVRKFKNNNGGSDGLVGELLKYGGSGMVELLKQLFTVIWR